MGFLKKLFGSKLLDLEALAKSAQVGDYAQIDLLARFAQGAQLHSERERRLWEQVLPRPYEQQIELYQKQGWLEKVRESYRATAAAQSSVEQYRVRQQQEKEDTMESVRKALEERDTGEALEIRKRYEAAQPLGSAPWTGPEPQLSHSALTRRILFLDHWLIEDLTADAAQWLKFYAAEQHLWGTSWRLDTSSIPPNVATELATAALDPVEAVYWRAHALSLYVENQDTWQRCKGGDHVRRLEIGGPDDEYTCTHCRKFRGEQYLVGRVPELPHRECTSVRGCRCQYMPVLESYDDLSG